MNQKTKGTLLSQTFKVEEKKVSLLFFNFWPRSRNMAIASVEPQEEEDTAIVPGKKANISAPLP